MISSVMIFICLSVSAQDSENVSHRHLSDFGKHKTQFQHEELDMYQQLLVKAKIAQQGWHFDFDAAYSPIGLYEISAQSSAKRAILKVNHTLGANIALVYQMKNGMRIGGATGVRAQQLEYSEDGDGNVSMSYGIPLYGRFGFVESISNDIAFYMDANLGILFGSNDLKTSFLWEAQLGVYYGNAKIGIGIMPTSPKPERFFKGEDIGNKVALNLGLFLGFAI